MRRVFLARSGPLETRIAPIGRGAVAMIPVYKATYLSGRTIPYERYVALQERLRAKRREMLLFCHHAPVLTAGVQARPESLRTDDAARSRAGVPVVRIGRGGDYTAHEPGQIVIYPHVDLKRRDLKMTSVFADWLEITAATLREVWDIEVVGQKEAPGLYTAAGAKLASIGVMFKSFFTSFGLAVNVANDLGTFDHIHPCGQAGLDMTSIVREKGDPALSGRFVETWSASFGRWLDA